MNVRYLGFVLFLFIVEGVSAENKIIPYVNVSAVWDDNLYRIDSSANVPATVSKKDTIYRMKAGVKVNWRLSRQQFLVDVSAVENRFDKNSNLNYVGQNLSLKWNWVIGSNLTGQFGFTQSSTLNDFSNTATQNSSKKVDSNASFLAKWRYSPDWELGFGLQEKDLSYDLPVLQTGDRKSSQKSIFWRYFSHSGNRIGITLQQEDGFYPNRVVKASTSIDNKYQQNAVLLDASWAVTAKSQVNAGLGWNARIHPSISNRDDDGFSANASYRWLPSSKVALDFSLYRKFVSSDYDGVDFSESTEYALGATWRASGKISFNGLFKQEVRDYVGQDDGFKERYESTVLGVTYQSDRMLDVSLRFNQGARDSEQISRDYSYQSLMLDLNVKLLNK